MASSKTALRQIFGWVVNTIVAVLVLSFLNVLVNLSQEYVSDFIFQFTNKSRKPSNFPLLVIIQAELALTCSKSTIGSLEQCVKFI